MQERETERVHVAHSIRIPGFSFSRFVLMGRQCADLGCLLSGETGEPATLFLKGQTDEAFQNFKNWRSGDHRPSSTISTGHSHRPQCLHCPLTFSG